MGFNGGSPYASEVFVLPQKHTVVNGLCCHNRAELNPHAKRA